jgi:hypothetical protein
VLTARGACWDAECCLLMAGGIARRAPGEDIHVRPDRVPSDHCLDNVYTLPQECPCYSLEQGAKEHRITELSRVHESMFAHSRLPI